MEDVINKLQERIDDRLREMANKRYYELQEYKKRSRATQKNIREMEGNMNGITEARLIANAVIKQFLKEMS